MNRLWQNSIVIALAVASGWSVATVARAAGDCQVRGFADERLTYQQAWLRAPLPPNDFPEQRSLTELNLQPKCKGDEYRAYADLSLLLRDQSRYVSVGKNGGADDATDDVPYRARATASLATNEAYLAHDFSGGASLLAGKKRIVWGAGFAFNPSDLINPAKDPTDPQNQRKGVWLAQAEVPFAADTLSFVLSPNVTERPGGMPDKVLRYHEGKGPERYDHYLTAVRYYMLLGGADVNLVGYYTNRYGDAFEHKFRLGFSVSKIVGNWALYNETLLSQGSAELEPNPACVGDETDAQRCLFHRQELFERSRQNDKRVYPRLVLGTRYQFEDDPALVVEFLHQNDGYSQHEFQSLVDLGAYVQRNTNVGLVDALQGQGRPLMKNYLAINYGDYKWNDDLGFFGSSLMNLQQGSGFAGPGVNYAPADWVKLSLRALELVTTKEGATIPGSRYRATEEELLGYQHSLIAEIKAYY